MLENQSQKSKAEQKPTAAVFIDGFNVYHFVEKHHPWGKWLDYRALAEVMLPKNIEVGSVYYFSALAKWDQDKVNRHQHYISALKARGIIPVINKFQNREKKVIVRDDSSNRYYDTIHGKIRGRVVTGYVNEEKQTDVSIGVHMIALAARNMYDVALLVSGDTDFLPIIEVLARYFPDKQIRMAVPSTRISAPFLNLLPGGACRLIKGKHIRKSLLDNPILDQKGKQWYCPTEWQSR